MSMEYFFEEFKMSGIFAKEDVQPSSDREILAIQKWVSEPCEKSRWAIRR